MTTTAIAMANAQDAPCVAPLRPTDDQIIAEVKQYGLSTTGALAKGLRMKGFAITTEQASWRLHVLNRAGRITQAPRRQRGLEWKLPA